VIRIGLIGPSKRRNGTGPFLARFFHDQGAVVVAVCGSSAVSSSHAAAELTLALGVPVKAFTTPEQMIERCALDAVAISSPAEHHADQLNIACRARLHTFCEKPLIWNSGQTELPLALANRVEQIRSSFLERGLVLHQNTQWTYVLNDLRMLLGGVFFNEMRSFEMAMAPPAPGLSMFWEAVPHPISMITALGVSGVPHSIGADFTEDLSGLRITFEAERPTRGPLHVCIRLDARAEQPRPCYMILNGVRIDREVVSMSPYELALRRDQRLYMIADPVLRSVKEFLERVRSRIPEDDSEIVKQFQFVDALWPEVLRAASARLAHP
jgi:hypothetical protein